MHAAVATFNKEIAIVVIGFSGGYFIVNSEHCQTLLTCLDSLGSLGTSWAGGGTPLKIARNPINIIYYSALVITESQN